MAKPSVSPVERACTLFVWGGAALVALAFACILVELGRRGIRELSWEFFVGLPVDAGRAGGILPILCATTLILLICGAVSVPIALAAAVYLAEFSSSESGFARVARRSLDVLAGIPSIVFGLFGNAFFCKVLGLGFSVLSGGLTLACMVLPILIRVTEEGFRAVPSELRASAAALGFMPLTTLRQVTLPLAIPALVVGLVLGIGRAVAETAALIFTSGYVDRMPGSVFDSGRALSIHIFDLSMNVPGGDKRAAASALVLLAFVLIVNVAASSVSQRWMLQRLDRRA